MFDEPNAFVRAQWWQCCHPIYPTSISSTERSTTLAPAHWISTPKYLATAFSSSWYCARVDYRPCCIAIDRTLCHLHHLHWLAFMINGSIDFLPAVDYQHPPRRLSSPFLMLITNSLFVDCDFFASFCLGPSLRTIPYSPLYTLLSKGCLLSGYCNSDINILAYYYAVYQFQRPLKFNFIQVLVQDNSSALYKSSLSSQAIATCSVQYWGKLLGLHSLSLSSWPYAPLTQDRWVDSTLVLPWERRSALEQQFHGVRLCAFTYITPIQIL